MTNESQVIDETRAAFEDILDEAPLAPDWANATGQVQPLRQVEGPTKPRLMTLGVAAVMLVLVGSLAVATVMLGSNSGGDDAADDPVTTSLIESRTTSTTHAGDVEPAPTHIGFIELVPSLGPEPRFDTSILGEEVSPDRSNPAIALDDELLGWVFDRDFTEAGANLYVGQLGGVYGFVISTADATGRQSFCQLRKLTIEGVVKSESDTWTCSNTTTGIVGSYGVSDRPDDPAILASRPLEVMALAFDHDVSVIAIEHSTGIKQWQRAFGGAALFVVEGANSTGRFTVTAYNAEGAAIAVWTP